MVRLLLVYNDVFIVYRVILYGIIFCLVIKELKKTKKLLDWYTLRGV